MWFMLLRTRFAYGSLQNTVGVVMIVQSFPFKIAACYSWVSILRLLKCLTLSTYAQTNA
jgi:hypothetical protein